MPRLLRKLQQTIPNARIDILYGSTEVEPISLRRNAQPPSLNKPQGLCVGQPIPELQVKILPLDNLSTNYSPYWFQALCLAPNQVGEIVVAGNHVLDRYLKNTGDRHTKIQVGKTIWHRTGDAGYLDENKQLWLVGRCTECKKLEEKQTYPFILEMSLQQHPKVNRAAALHHTGNNHIFIEAKDRKNPPTPAELNAFLPSDHKLHFLKRMPVDRRHNGKIIYRHLLKRVQKVNR